MPVLKYRKLPVVIEAIQLTKETFDEAVAFINTSSPGCYPSKDICVILIPTLEGDIKAIENDHIIKGVKGEFYPCKPDIFEQTYELADVND